MKVYQFETRGITPAYAGRMMLMALLDEVKKDHPRIRGKNYIFLVASANLEGSPPHTREESRV